MTPPTAPKSRTDSAVVGLLVLLLAVAGAIHLHLVPGWHATPPLHLITLLGATLLPLALASRRNVERERRHHREEKLLIHRRADTASARYRLLMEAAGDAIFTIRGDGTLATMNGKGLDLFRLPEPDPLPLCAELVAASARDEFLGLLERVSREDAGGGTFPFTRPDGGTFFGELTARMVDLGEERVVLCIVRDITNRREAEREIVLRNRRLSLLNTVMIKGNRCRDLQAMAEMVLAETVAGLNATAGALHLFEDDGLTLRLAAARNLPDVPRTLPPEKCSLIPCITDESPACRGVAGAPAHACPFARWGAETGTPVVGIPLFGKKRQTGIIHLVMGDTPGLEPKDLPFLGTLGTQIGIMVEHTRLFEELTWKTEELERSCRLLGTSSHRLSLSENRLRDNLAVVEQANLELERLDRMKNQFLGMISHEFRTPLTGILSGTQYLLSGNPPIRQEEREVLEIIHEGGMRLHEIVDDLLKVARLEAKKVVLAKSPVQVAEVFYCVRERLRPLLEERRQQVNFAGSGVPLFFADRQYLEDVVAELLKNAVKFTPDGGEISVAARVVDRIDLERKKELLGRFNDHFLDQASHGCFLEIEVTDNGIGVPLDEQVKIFDKFYELGDIRHHSSGDSKFQGKGTGVGLAIVKGMVEAHGGMVWVESAAGPGSSFVIVLPLEEGPSQTNLPFTP